MPDRAYTFQHDEPPFHRAPAPSRAELHALLDTLIARITPTLARGGVLVEEAEHPYLDLELDSPLQQLSGAAVRYRIALGPQAGRKTITLRNPSAMADEAKPTKPFTAARGGFSIHAISRPSFSPEKSAGIERETRVVNDRLSLLPALRSRYRYTPSDSVLTRGLTANCYCPDVRVAQRYRSHCSNGRLPGSGLRQPTPCALSECPLPLGGSRGG